MRRPLAPDSPGTRSGSAPRPHAPAARACPRYRPTGAHRWRPPALGPAVLPGGRRSSLRAACVYCSRRFIFGTITPFLNRTGACFVLVFHSEFSAGQDPYLAFAIEEWLCREAGAGRLPGPIVHLWRHERAFVLGLRDSRLPRAAEAMERMEREEGWRVMVRNSGGAAVPLDPGVVNVTLIRPSEPGRIDLHADFRAMAELLAETLAPFGVSFDIGEIAGAYCPGDFDLSIGGRKFCGMAQRRQTHAHAVQAFINAEGDSLARAAVVREFYRLARGEAEAPLDVRPSTMGSLAELNPSFPGADAWLQSLIRTFGTPQPLPPGGLEASAAVAASFRNRYDPRYSRRG